MSKIIKISMFLLFFFNINIKALTIVDLDNLEFSKGNNYQKIIEYKDYDSFIKDYKNNKLPSIYITDYLFDGISKVKDIDLDKSNYKDLKVNVININNTGDYELRGSYKGMIAINTNNQKGDINIILNNVNIDSNTKKAPSIYVFNKDKKYNDCTLTIKTLKDTNNILSGGRLKKVSLIPKDELNNYEKYYKKDALKDYQFNPNYYGIYNKDEIKNLLFATVIADQDGLKDGDPYYFYKASGAISSDINLHFKGEGYLKVISKNNEGIESKGNLEFIGGIGDYEIISFEDALNTTTKDEGNNDLLIDVHSLVAKINFEAQGGDAIDSNGKLEINGGIIYAFAHPTSNDSSLDSVHGIYLNGGTIMATGNKTDNIAVAKQKYIYFTLDKEIDNDTLIVIKNEKDKIIMAYKAARNFKNLLYSSPNLKYKSYKVYKGGNIIGNEINGLYNEITSYTGGSLIYSSNNQDNTNSMILVYISILVIVLLGFIIANYLRSKKEDKDK